MKYSTKLTRKTKTNKLLKSSPLHRFLRFCGQLEFPREQQQNSYQNNKPTIMLAIHHVIVKNHLQPYFKTAHIYRDVNVFVPHSVGSICIVRTFTCCEQTKNILKCIFSPVCKFDENLPRSIRYQYVTPCILSIDPH